MTAIDSIPLLATCLICGVIVLVSGILECTDKGTNRYFFTAEGQSSCSGLDAYAVSVGAVSMALAGAYFIVLKVIKNADHAAAMLPYVGLFLFLWWPVGAAVLTFKGPFLVPGNGYFASLIAAVAAVKLGLQSSDHLQKALDKVQTTAEGAAASADVSGTLLVQILGGGIELVAASLIVAEGGVEFKGYFAYAVFAGAIGVCMSVALLLLPLMPPRALQAKLPLALATALWWGVAAIVLTFITPFKVVSNGYIGCWLAAAASVATAVTVLQTTPPAEPAAAQPAAKV